MTLAASLGLVRTLSPMCKLACSARLALYIEAACRVAAMNSGSFMLDGLISPAIEEQQPFCRAYHRQVNTVTALC